MSSSLFDDALLDELSCPVCFEDFVEPKCLPSCAHNICKGCLEDIIKARVRKSSVHFKCPICRGNVPITREGVSAIPTNTMIKRLLEKASVPRAEKEIMKALERGKEKMEELRKSQEPGQSSADGVEAKGETIKRAIREKRSLITKMIKSQEELMIAKVNEYVKKSVHKDPVNEMSHLLKKLELSVKQAEDVLREPNSFKKVQSKETIVKMLEASCHFEMTKPSKGSRAFDLDFFPNEDLEQQLKKEWFGKVAKESEENSTTKHQAKVTVVKTITADDIGETSFNPYAIALSAHKGEMAVLDDESNRVHILTESGNYLRSFSVKFGDLYDVAFLHEGCLDGVIVVNRSHNRLLAYHRLNGKFSPMFNSSVCKSIQSQFSKVNFSSVSTTPDGHHLIVTSEALDESCVMVINVQAGVKQKSDLVFGKGHLLCPRKALYYNEEFFVCDRDDGVVKVFDRKGACQREIGVDLECPRGIAIDECTGNILIADPGTDAVHAFDTCDGAFVGKIVLDEAPVSIGINCDGNAVVCSQDTLPCLQILSYRF